jgi:hypothetical protein
MSRFDRLALLAAVGSAALLRLPGIDARGRFDADQGHDMLTLVAFTRDAVVPLLGPKTSVGEFHHGAFYYFLLAPAAAISNGDPVAVTIFLALLGIGAVALTWWLARAIGGPLAGAVAGLLLAVSPAGIDESTFIWNPNPIGFFALLSLAAAWRARTGNHAWWAVALGAAGAVVQLHVLGVVFLIAIVAIAILELRRDGRIAPALLGGVGLVVILFLPLIVHELQTGFLETQRVLDWIKGGDEGTGAGPIATLLFTLLRVVSWPIVGVVTDVPAAAAIVLAVVVGLIAVGLKQAPRGEEATGLRWLVGILAWSTLALAFAAPSLQRVVPGLPNDHYHAFLDPIVVILISVSAARLFARALAAWRTTHRPAPAIGGIAVGVGLALLMSVALLRKPPPLDPDGGWPAMRAAGARVAARAGDVPIAVWGLPSFKLGDAIAFPIAHAGGNLATSSGMPIGAGVIVVPCDRLFAAAIGAPCGGPAEDLLIDGLSGGSTGGASRPGLLDRFDASPRTSISVYGP